MYIRALQHAVLQPSSDVQTVEDVPTLSKPAGHVYTPNLKSLLYWHVLAQHFTEQLLLSCRHHYEPH